MDTMRVAATPFTDADRDSSTPRTLREATQEFESVFVAQMLKTMRRTVPESKLLGSGSGQTIFREMLDQELSRQIAHSGGFGIGEMLYEQLAGDRSEQGAAGEGEAPAEPFVPEKTTNEARQEPRPPTDAHPLVGRRKP